MIDAKDEKGAAWYELFGAVSRNHVPLSLLLPYSLFKNAPAKSDATRG